MCQNQNGILVKINAQINLVLRQVKNFKHSLSHLKKIRNTDFPFAQTYQKLENLLSLIHCFDVQDEQDQSSLTYCESDYDQKTYFQIIGDGQHIEEKDIQEEQPNDLFLSPEDQKYFIDDDFNSVRGSYRSYSTEQKLHVIKLHQEGNKYAYISRILGIPQKNIVRWCKKGAIRKAGAGRKIGDVQMEMRVIQWIHKKHVNGEQLRGKQIRQKAKCLSNKDGFKSSKGWLKNFVRRYLLNQKYVIG